MDEQTEMQRKREAVKLFFYDPVKVDDMPDKQVIAIYLKYKREGKVQ